MHAVDALSVNLRDGIGAPAGFVVGRTFRFVEWDLTLSPKEPNGDMISVQVRTGQMSRQVRAQSIHRLSALPAQGL